MATVDIRKARVKDVEIVYNFIKELAKYERVTDKFVATLDDIKAALAPKCELNA